MKRASRQFELLKRPWGGRRSGAGRKPAPGRGYVPHRRRPAHDPRCPVHATLRVRAGLPSLRRDDVFGVTRAALATASHDRFRVVHFSVQTDHVHLLLEGDGHIALQRGLQGLAIRVAKAVNRTLGRRGKLWADRYHARVLATPREVRHALVYVLQNVRKHLRGVRGLDPRSSARWSSGWRTPIVVPPGASPVAPARTWLAGVGWRRHGLVDIDEAPRARWRQDVRRARTASPTRPGASVTATTSGTRTTSA
jgi:putative transposase